MKTIGTFHIVLLAVVCRRERKRAIKLTLADDNHRRKTRVIKLATLLLPILLFLTESAYSQTITLNKKDAPLEDIFFDITKQTGYNFKYKDSLIQKAKRVTVNLDNSSLIQALDLLSKQQPLLYSIDGKNVLVNILPVEVFQPKEPPVIGRVTDVDGNPLAGTYISVRATNQSAVAEADGSFKITEVESNSFLEFSHVGFEPQLLKLPPERDVRVRLVPVVKTLDEVIFKGYTSVTKRDNTGSITTINAEDIGQANNIFVAMQARVPGLIVTQRSGLPGSPYTIQLRGQKSMGITPNGQLPSNSPLFIIDGIPFITGAEVFTQRRNILANSPFSTINPDDIESITILKDPNATSIYGSLGANGVILITTKKAKPGSPSVTVDLNAGWGKVTHTMDYMNTDQYVELRNEALKNDMEVADPTNAPDLIFWGTTRYTDWKKILLGGTARFTNGHIRLAGGSDLTQFALSVGFNKETTVFPGDHGKTFTSATFNIEHKSPNRKLELSLTTSYGFDKSKLFSRDPTFGITTPPNSPTPYDSLGRLNFRENGYPFNNPLSYLSQPYDMIMERMTSGVRLNYKIMRWLNLKINAGYNIITGDEKLALPISSQDPALNPTGSATFGTNKSRNWIVEPQVEFVDTIGNGALKAVAGSSLRSRTGISDLQEGFGYTNDASLNSINNATTVTATHDFNEYRVISAYGLINYKWKGKYIIEGTIRRDGSSRFGPNRKFGTFSSLAGAWIFSNEKFITDVFPVLSFGKLRATYGTTGNDQIGDYQFLDAWEAPRYPYQNPTLIPSRLANADYHWERQRSIDIGLDLGFCKDRFLLSLTWNQGRTSDQLVAFTLPSQTGFNKIIKNIPAVTQNRNIEIVVTSENINKIDFQWTTSLNLSIQRNKLIKFPGLETTDYGRNKFVIGQPLNLYWGYRTAGLDEELGILRFLDKNNKLIDFNNTLPSEDDHVNLGTFDPDYYGGLQNNIKYKKWQLSFLFHFVKQLGKDPIYGNDKPPGFIINQPVDVLRRWQQPGDPARYPQYTQNVNSFAYYSWYSASTSDLVLTDASFIRLKTLMLSYNLPVNKAGKLRIKSSQLYVQGQNLLTFTHFKGNDPETHIDRDLLPPLKTFTFGIRATF